MRTLSNRMGSIRQGEAFNGDCGASKYSRSRIAPIEPVFSCTDPPEPRFMTAASTSAVGSSIGVGFVSATVLKAMSTAAGIKGFIGLPSLLNASGNDRPVPRFQNVQFRTHEIVPATRPDGKAGASYERRAVWQSGQLFSAAACAETGPEFSADADYRGLCRRTPRSIEAWQTKCAPMIDRADRQAGESAMEDTNIIDFRKRNSIEMRDASLTHGDTHLRYARDRHARLFGNMYAAKEHEALPAACRQTRQPA
jgi:hypothetical protein